MDVFHTLDDLMCVKLMYIYSHIMSKHRMHCVHLMESMSENTNTHLHKQRRSYKILEHFNPFIFSYLILILHSTLFLSTIQSMKKIIFFLVVVTILYVFLSFFIQFFLFLGRA